MRKYLIVAQKEDIKWFSPILFDKIFIVFSDKEEEGEEIVKLGLRRSGYNKDKSKLKEYKNCFDILIRRLKTRVEKDVEFWTYYPWGDNHHPDNILISQAVVEIGDRFRISVHHKDEVV